jgi:hypothetical protein
MEDLFGPYLMGKGKVKQQTAKALAQKEYILIYFGASWAPGCRHFTPILFKFYQ